jgi:flavin-binding protein dodecin
MWIRRSFSDECQAAVRVVCCGGDGEHVEHRARTTMDRCGRSDHDWMVHPEPREVVVMSVYRVIDVIGTSSSSWEEAAAEAITTARGSVRDIRVAEVTKQDIVIGDAGELLYRTKIQLSFKYESE